MKTRNMTTVEIEYLEVPLTCIGNYEKEEMGQMFDENMEGYPYRPATFEIIKILDEEDSDVTDEYDENDLETITLFCLDNV
jgi:hypothetical protein